jgi:hypothetical protein
MASVKSNLAMQGLEGMLGKQLIFRQLNGKTVVSIRSTKPLGPPSEKQLANRERFKQARAWAKEQLKDPEVAAFWKSKCVGNQSAMSLLIGEAPKDLIVGKK